MATPLALRVVESNFLTYKRVWKGSAFSSFLMPTLFLLAMGLGLGSLVDEGSGTAVIERVEYIAFLAPGLLTPIIHGFLVVEGLGPRKRPPDGGYCGCKSLQHSE